MLHSATTPPEVAMLPAELPTSLDTLLTHRHRTRAGLLRVKRAIGVDEALACAAAMPPELHPPLPRRPTLSRGALRQLEESAGSAHRWRYGPPPLASAGGGTLSAQGVTNAGMRVHSWQPCWKVTGSGLARMVTEEGAPNV